jgi:N-acetylmuramoyl-L-alanine amidase
VKPADVKYLVVHCSATPPEQDIGAKEIDRMHRERGFLKIGYHFVIRRNGNIESGRRWTKSARTSRDTTHESLGICMVGGVAKARRRTRCAPEQFVTTSRRRTTSRRSSSR